MGRGAHVVVVGMALVVAAAGTAAAGPRVVFAPVYGEADVADEAAAVHLLVRSAFAGNPGAVGDVAAPTPTLDTASARLAEVDADHLVLIEVDRLGPNLVATAQIIDRTGAVAGKVASEARDGGVTELATALAHEIGAVTGLTAVDPPELSLGQIRPFARAYQLVTTGAPGDAARALAGADPMIAVRVPAAGAVATALWSDPALEPAARLVACMVACTPRDVATLTAGDLGAPARTARALAQVGLSDPTAAAAELTGAVPAETALARAAIAELRQDRHARDVAVAELVAAQVIDRAALAWIAKLPAGVLPAPTEAATVGAGERVGDRRLAAAIGLRAAEAGAMVDRALALIAVVELDRSERARLKLVVAKATCGGAAGSSAPTAGPCADALRLTAELALADNDLAAAKAALVKLRRSTDPRAALYRGRIAWLTGDFVTAVDELSAAAATTEQARVLLAKGDARAAATAAGASERSRLAQVAGAEVALLESHPTDAVVRLRAAEQLAPGDRDTQSRLANALELAGDPVGAKIVRARLMALAEPAVATAAAVALEPDGSGAGSGSGDPTMALATGNPRVRAKLRDLLAGFPPAALTSSALVFAPIGAAPSAWALKEVDPEPVLHELGLAIEAGYGGRVVARSDQRFADRPTAADLSALAARTGASGVLLYHLSTDGAIRLVVFDVDSQVAYELTGSIDIDALDAVHWRMRWLMIPIAIIGVLVALVLFALVRGSGVIEVKVKRDPNGTNPVLCVELQKTRRRWVIRDLEAFRAVTTKAGAKVGRRTARLVGDLTRFKVPPGHWFVHLYGVYDRPGGARMLDDRHTAEVELGRNKSELVEIDLVPRTAELRVKVYDDDQLRGIALWLDTGAKFYTNDKGEVVIYAPLGEHTLHVEAKGITLDRELSFHAPLVETIEINLTRERRLAEVSGGLSLQKRAVDEASPTMRAEAELDLPEEAPLELPPKPMSIAKLAAAATISQPMPVLTPVPPAHVAAGSVVPPAATAVLTTGVTPIIGDDTPGAIPDLLCGRYRVKKVLGRGAMGVVYRANDQNLEREVAIKVLAADLRHHPDAMRFFTEEAKALAQLNHPNIVSVYDQATDANDTYLIMEYVDGRTLDSLLEEKSKVPVHTALALIDQLCTGLAYVHARRVIHRDIKPANIFVSRDRMVKLGDFGLARVMRELSIRKTEIRGTPLYMAPEQITGENVTHRSDLYAVGCTLFELVTGRPPFTDGEILYHHLHTAPPRPSDLEPALSPAFDELVLDCIAKDADARIESATAIRDRIRALGAQPAPPVAATGTGP